MDNAWYPADVLKVLHISDLHRSVADPLSNDELLASVLADLDYLRERGALAGSLSAVVVSGDIVQGAKLGAADYNTIIRQQYALSGDFLARLTEELLGGDRSRVVIVPGNHDACFNTSAQSMVIHTPSPGENARELLLDRQSPYRWDWTQLRMLRISDPDAYEHRWDQFVSFYQAFYNGTPPERIGNDVTVQNIEGTLFVGFNSCSTIDCFNDAAYLPPDTIARTALALRNRRANLRVAVWHHNIDGPPMATDYLAVDSVKRLTFHGFRLGFHGHQHQSGTGAVYVHTDEDEVMAVVSASSLCAGRRDLSPGRLRGFNIVSIDPADCNCDVSARLMDFSAVISPEYCFNRGRGNRQVRWTRFRNEGTEAESLNTLVLAAEAKLRSGQADQARTLLLPALAKLDDFGRALLLEAMLALGNAVEAWSTLGPSLSPEQASQLAGVLVEAGRIGETKALLEHFLDRLSPIVKRELEARIRQMTISLGGRDVRG